VGRLVNQASPHQNGASWPELIPMVSGFAQTAPSDAETDSDLNCPLYIKLSLLKGRINSVESGLKKEGSPRGLTPALRFGLLKLPARPLAPSL
jgi:hypothetical protein